MFEPRYGQIPITFNLFDRVYTSVSLVSKFGAMRVFDLKKVHSLYGSIIRKKTLVDVHDTRIKAKFYSEVSNRGSFYGFKFVSLDRLGLNNLAYQIEKNQTKEPWQRRYPRIPTDLTTKNAEYNLPVMGTLYFRDVFEVCKVVNFTLNGVLLETQEDTFSDALVGAQLKVDLYTSGGDTIPQIQGTLVRISEEFCFVRNKTIRTMAMRFDSMPPVSDYLYKKLIRNFAKKYRSK